MQYRITKPSKLLDKEGKLIQKGYATYPILTYQRNYVANKLRLKEWDYYLIMNKEYTTAVTIAQSGNLVLFTANLIDLQKGKELNQTGMKLVSRKRFELPEASTSGNIVYKDANTNISIKIEKNVRILNVIMKSHNRKPRFELSMILHKEPRDSMVIATPFNESPKHFYYNRKIIGMKASGYVRYHERTYHFSPDVSYGILDWGRGVWPYKTTWYWSAACGMVYNRTFAFNLGYGFGNTSKATENMLFYHGIAQKLTNVTFHIPKNEQHQYDYMKPWTITSSDQRIDMIFLPIYDRSLSLSAAVLSTNQHQVFGKFTGRAILDDGSVIYFRDFYGFAERVENRW